jgi:hypothetical protein
MINHSTTSSAPLELFDEQSQIGPPAVIEPSESLGQRVRLFLAASHVPGLRRVEVEVVGDTVTLRGRVRTFYEKQLAARLVRHVAGVIHVVDLVEARGYTPRVEFGHVSRRRVGNPPPWPVG